MNKKKYNIIDTLLKRGFIYQSTNLEKLRNLCEKKISVYIGFDCTAPSLHVGSLVQIMLLRQLQQHGHTPIIVIGKSTTKIGDPSGKDKVRKVLPDATVEKNFSAIKSLLGSFLSWEVSNKPIILDNSLWFKNLTYLDFLKDFGKHFSINRMITFESVKSRLDREQPLSFLEFNYMLLQSYDYYKLQQEHGCILQIGGSDQWGNIISGIDLVRKMTGKTVYGLTTPLLVTSSGIKMGKTEEGAVWLSEKMVSHYDYWQFWRNVSDSDLIKFLYLFTELSPELIQTYSSRKGKDLNDVKIILANEATKICRGTQAAQQAEETAASTFYEQKICLNLPRFQITDEMLSQKVALFQLMTNSNLAKTNSESKRLIESRAVKINDQLVEDKFFLVEERLFINDIMKISVGKKKSKLIIKSSRK